MTSPVLAAAGDPQRPFRLRASRPNCSSTSMDEVAELAAIEAARRPCDQRLKLREVPKVEPIRDRRYSRGTA